MALIQAPLNGATPGNWQVVQFSGNGIGMNYCVLLPYNYSSANSYPLLMYLHENGYGGDQTGNFCLYQYESQGQGCDIWFNNTTFRTYWPCIVVVPLLNENQDNSGNTQNWGGWGGPNPQPSQLNCLTIIQTLINQYSVYTPKIYVTGDSLGGIGTWEFMIQYNAWTGLSGTKLFAAGWSESGGVLLYGNPPNQNVITAMQNVPMFAVRGASDNSTGPQWDQQMYAAYGGGTANGSKAPNGNMYYINDANLGHDVWGTYRNLTASFGSTTPASSMLNWMFSQSSTSIPQPAANAGYNLRTFGPSVTLNTNWWNTAAGNSTQNSDGSLRVTGGSNNYGWHVTTITPDTSNYYAFGGGGYIVATLSWTGTYNSSGGYPAWWSNPLETMLGTWPGTGSAHWPGQAAAYGDQVEVDFMEFYGQALYGTALHNWYGLQPNPPKVDTNIPQFTLPSGARVSDPHRYGFLWIPATASTPGHASFYFDDVKISGSDVYWNLYNPNLNPPPVLGTNNSSISPGSSAFSVLDVQHLVLVLGSTSNNPMTVSAVEVWQATGANNLPATPTTPTIPTSPTQPTTPTPSGSWITPTSGGSVTDASGNIWTLGSDGYLYENTNQVPLSSGTDRLTVVNGVIWARDKQSGTWYTYVNGNFISQGTAIPPTPPTPTTPTSPTSPTPTSPTVPTPPNGSRKWYQIIGGDRSLLTTPFQTTASWITSGTLINQLRGLTFANVRSYDTTGYVTPFWVSLSSNDILCTFHDSTGTIADFQMRVPAGAHSENGPNAGDNSACFIDSAMPYKYVTINDCRIGSNSSNASGSGIVSATNKFIMCGPGFGSPGGMIVQDATGPTLMDAITGTAPATAWENGDNGSGSITYYDLQQCNADPNYVIQHMIACNLGANVFSSTKELLWPFTVSDLAGTGSIPEGAIIGIPASTTRPASRSRAFYVLFDLFQHFGAIFNNVTQNGQIGIKTMPGDSATANLVANMLTEFINVLPYLCILNYTSGTAGAQYGLSTLKGRLANATTWSDAFPAPATLDFSQTGGVSVLPSTFGAWQAANGLGQVYNVNWESTITLPTTPTSPTPTRPTPTAPTPTLPTPTSPTPTAPTPTLPTPTSPTPTLPTPTSPTPTAPTPTLPTPTLPTPTSPTPTAPTPTLPTPTSPTPTAPTPTLPTPTSPTPTAPTPTVPTVPTILVPAKNGVIEFTSAVSLLYFWQSVVYLKTVTGAWFSWNGNSFISSGNPLSPTPTIPTPTIPTPTIPTPTIPTPTRPTPTIPTPTRPTPTLPTPTSPTPTVPTSTLVLGPLPNATTGSWVTSDSNGQHNTYLLPHGYSSSDTNTYSMIMYLHYNQQAPDSVQSDVDSYFNNVAFRQAYPALVVVPFYTNDRGDWGGSQLAPTVTETATIAVAQRMISTFKIDVNRVYIVGVSQGGEGAWCYIIRYNRVNGNPRIFQAAMPFDGNPWYYTNQGLPNAATFDQIRTTPINSVHGSQDTTVNPNWDNSYWSYLGGTTTDGRKAPNGMFRLFEPAMGHGTWNEYLPLPTGQTRWDWLFGAEANVSSTAPTTPTPPGGTTSPDGTTITTVGPAITDANGILWTLTSGAQVAVNGVADTTTRNVIELVYYNGLVYQENASLGWWSKSTPSDTWLATSAPITTPTAPTTPTPGGTGTFRVSNGLFIAPDGNSFIGRGVNIYSIDQAVTNAACQPLTTLFPNISFIRLPTKGYPSVASLSTYIDRCVAANIVVAIEDHMYPSGSPPTGSTQNNWYASFASHYINQPFVWFMTTNEPTDPGVTANHVAIYNAVRGTGSNAIVLFDPIGGGGPGRQGPNAFDQSQYANMTNVGWDQHFYAWMINYTSNQSTVNAGIAQFIAEDHQITSRDGVMPVFIGEWGDSTDGSNVDGDWQNIVTAVTTCGYGSAAWNYDELGGGDVLVHNGALTAYGQLVSNYCAAGTRANRSLHMTAAAVKSRQQITTPASSIITAWNTGTLMMLDRSNLTASSIMTVPQGTRSTTTVNAGRVYFEITMLVGTPNFAIGLISSEFDPSTINGLGSDPCGIGYYPSSQTILLNNNQLTTTTTTAGSNGDGNGAILSIAVDFSARKFWASSPAMRSVGNTWNNTVTDDPALTIGGADLEHLAPGPYYIAFNERDGGGTAVLNVGAARFDQPIPAGFVSWGAAVLHPTVSPPTPTLSVSTPTESINWCNTLVLPAMQWVGNSDHVAVYYDTNSYTSTEGISLCSQFLATCDIYYRTLVTWFNGYQPNNSNGLGTLQNPAGNLINYFIVSNGSDQAGHCSCINADILVDFAASDRTNMDAIFCEFLLELSEVFMPSLSALPDCDRYALGEGMSNAMGIELHSGGIGTTIANLATEWMDQTVAGVQRDDFVNNNVIYNTKDPAAVTRLVGPGCCCVFFFYLRFQLYFTWPQITAALDLLPPRCNLQQVYQMLTDDPTDPFPAFLALLNSIYPPSVPLGEFFNPLRLFPI